MKDPQTPHLFCKLLRMRKPALYFFCFILFSVAAKAQGLKKSFISQSGCSLYTYCELKYEASASPDSSLVYTGECEKDNIHWGVICVKLSETKLDPDQAEDLLINYLDYLRSSFKIDKAAGYGKGYRLNKDENTRGVLDYWEDKDKQQWKVKGWTNGRFIAVLYAYSLKELPESKVNVFLDGFRFPVAR